MLVYYEASIHQANEMPLRGVVYSNGRTWKWAWTNAQKYDSHVGNQTKFFLNPEFRPSGDRLATWLNEH